MSNTITLQGNSDIVVIVSEETQPVVVTLDGTQGLAGKNGKDGKSAYQIAVDNGYVGSESQWIQDVTMAKWVAVDW